jgi:hypothetical protein
MLLAELALATTAAFAGTAVYVAAVEQPARLALDDAAALRQWKPSYARGKIMQAALALVGGALALWIFGETKNMFWFSGGVLLLAPWPFTLLVIMPTNHRLEAMQVEAPEPETRFLLIRWGELHWVRMALGCGALISMLCALAST